MQLKIDTSSLDHLEQALQRMQDRIRNHKPAMEAIGGHVVQTTQERIIKTKQGPDGKSWAAGSTLTEKLRKTGASLLFVTGTLSKSIKITRADGTSVTITADTTMVGASKDYAPYVQGGVKNTRGRIPGKTIPPRPFLGLSESDKHHIVDIMNKYIQGLNG